jgi:hypothetical protein
MEELRQLGFNMQNNIKLTEEEFMVLVIVAQVKLGLVQLQPDQLKGLENILKSSKKYVQDIAKSIQEEKTDGEAGEIGAQIVEWVKKNS